MLRVQVLWVWVRVGLRWPMPYPCATLPTGTSSKDKKKGKKKSKLPSGLASAFPFTLSEISRCSHALLTKQKTIHYRNSSLYIHRRQFAISCTTEDKPLVKDLATHVVLDSASNYSTCIAFHPPALFAPPIFCHYSPLPGLCTHSQWPWGEDSRSHHPHTDSSSASTVHRHRLLLPHLASFTPFNSNN